MDSINILKITLSFVACVFAFIAGIIEIKKDPKALLNRFFASFIMFLSLGLLFYTLYHVTKDISMILFLALLNNICFNISFSCLYMVPRVIQLSSVDPRLKKDFIGIFIVGLGTLLLLIPFPLSVDLEQYAEGVVSIDLNKVVLVILNVFRIIILFYALGSFLRLLPKVEGIAHRRIKYFTIGLALSMITIIGAIVANLIPAYEQLLKVVALLGVIAGTAMSFRGFLIADEK